MMAEETRKPSPPPPLMNRHQSSPLEALSRLIKNYFFATIAAAVFALLLRVYVVEAFRIPTDFMAPALVSGDHIFVNKLAYASIFNSDKMPGRGDVVIFSLLNDPAKDYIKRVVAIEGDTIAIGGGSIAVNGKGISQPTQNPDVFVEEVGNHKYLSNWEGTPIEMRKMVQVKVPAGQIFVLGDNRSKGQDSRSWGFLPASLVKGRASVIWFSTTGSGNGKELWGVRWSRLLTAIH